MKKSDFIKYNLDKVTCQEVENTGTDLENVELQLILKVHEWRLDHGYRIGLLYNGINSGSHSSEEHPKGQALDCFIYNDDNTTIDIQKVFRSARKIGFSSIGIYYCEETNIYCIHLSIGNRYVEWCAFKNKKKDKWKYRRLIVDPRLI